jgi:hypothetical protein
MDQITQGESLGHPGMDIPDPPGRSRGLYAINDHYNSQYGATNMRNPILNTLAASAIAKAAGGPNANIWHGSSHVTGWNLHFDGDPAAIAKHIGGSGMGSHEIAKTAHAAIKGGTTSAGGGTYAPGKVNVATAKLGDFGSLPDTLPRCRKELEERRLQREKYQINYHQSKDPKEKQAIKTNIELLTKRIGALRKQQLMLVRKEATKHAIKRIGHAAEFVHWTAPNVGEFAKREYDYNYAQELADQAVTLEPEEPSGGAGSNWINSILKPYVEGTETPAYGSVLGAEEGWRNSIIGAEGFAEGKIGAWGEQITRLKERIASIQALKGKPAYAKQVGLIPGLRQTIRALWGSIKTTRNETLPEWESSLGGVQGLGRTHDIVALTGIPTGEFGGNIFDTQMTIKGLGLKVSQALQGAAPDNSEREALLEELLRQANQRNIARGIEEKVFAGMSKPGGIQLGGLVKVMPPYAGKAHAGAIVPGPPTQERTMVVKGGEGIFTTEQLAAMGGDGGSIGDVKVHIHGDIVSSHPDPVQVLINDKRFPAEVRKVTEHDGRRTARGAGRRLPGNAGVFG